MYAQDSPTHNRNYKSVKIKSPEAQNGSQNTKRSSPSGLSVLVDQHDMGLQVAFVTAGVVAQRAVVGSLASMTPHVHFVIVDVTTNFAAVGTHSSRVSAA